MPFVVNVSLATGWVVADEHTPLAETLLQGVRVDGPRVPDLFWHEMRNVLLKTERRRRSQQGAAENALVILRRLPIIVQMNRSDDLILSLARAYRLTPYDASYLDLSIGLQLPLATADRQLAQAAHDAGKPVLGLYAATAS